MPQLVNVLVPPFSLSSLVAPAAAVAETRGRTRGEEEDYHNDADADSPAQVQNVHEKHPRKGKNK